MISHLIIASIITSTAPIAQPEKAASSNHTLIKMSQFVSTSGLEQYIVPALIPVIFVSDFDEMSAKQFMDQMDDAIYSGADMILISIDSYGGQVYALLAMMNKIEAAQKLGITVATVVEGKSMSCGAVLFSAGSHGYRFVGPYSTILIHSVSAGARGKVSEMINTLGEVKRLNEMLFTILARKTGKPDKYYLNIIKDKGDQDWYISPKEAVDLGLASKIKVPQVKTKVIIKNVIE